MPSTRLSPEQEELYSQGDVENLNQDLHETKEKLLALKQQMEEYERRERELEELKAKKHEVIHGQKAFRERFTRALAALERADFDTKRKLEQIQTTHQLFSEHLQNLEGMDPNGWSADEMEEQLTRALTQIEQARSIYSQFQSKLNLINHQEGDEELSEEEGSSMAGNDRDSFMAWMLKGLAFTLPLIVALIFLGFLLLATHKS